MSTTTHIIVDTGEEISVRQTTSQVWDLEIQLGPTVHLSLTPDVARALYRELGKVDGVTDPDPGASP